MQPPKKDGEPGKPDQTGKAPEKAESAPEKASARQSRDKAKTTETGNTATKASAKPETTKEPVAPVADGTKSEAVSSGKAPAERTSVPGQTVAEPAKGASSVEAMPEVRKEAAKTPPPTGAPATTAAPRPGRGGFLSSLIGAIVGGVIGAAGVWYYLQQQDPPGPDPALVSALDEQRGEVATLTERLATVEGDIGSLNEALRASDLSDAIEQLRIEAEGRFDGVTGTLSTVSERLDAAEARLDETGGAVAELESRPIADPETANQVLRSEVADMREEVRRATEEARAQVEAMRGELSTAAEQTQAQIVAAEERAAELEAQAQQRIREAEAEAEAMARAAEAEAALARIEAAIDSGEPFPDALATLTANAEADVPEALSSTADTGVPTIAALREDYPDAARTALSATAVASTEGEPAGRLVAFLRNQTQARSLTPREGDSPDAILSRAEAALENGDTAAALAELEALPEDGRAAMQDWIDDARRRAEAAEAAETLLQKMN